MFLKKRQKLIILVMAGIIVSVAVGTVGAINGWFGGGGKIPSDTMTRGLASYWSFDEGRGTTTADISGNNNTVNFATVAASPAWTLGYPSTGSGRGSGGALLFDASDDYAKNVSNGSLPTSAMSLEAWVNISNLADWRVIAEHDKDSTGGWNMNIDASGNANLTIYNGASYLNGSKSGIATNAWYHIVGVYDGSNVKMYINGVVGTDAALAGQTLDSAGDVFIGADHYLGNLFSGKIDEVRIYNRALSEAEIRYHYNRGGPVAYWKFDEGAGTTAYDASGNGNNGTLQNNMATTSWTSGKYGSALSFDGVDDYIDAGSGSTIDDLTAFTYSVWVKQNSQGLLQKLWDKNWKRARVNANGTLQADITAATVAASTVTTNTVTPGVWTHIVLTYNDSGDRKGRFYINGVEASYSTQTPASGSLTSEADNVLKIGADSLYFFNGLIDDVRIYNYARTPEQILRDYNAGFSALFGPQTDCDRDPGSCMTKGLAGFWNFDEGTGATLTDISGNDNNGTLTSGPSWVSGAPCLAGAKCGGGLRFDGSNDHVVVEDSDFSVFGPSTEGSVESWMNPASFTHADGTPMWFTAEGGSLDLQFLLQASGRVDFNPWQLAGAINSGSNVISLNSWNHVVGTWGNNGARLYLNGVLVGSYAAGAIVTATSTQDIYIGRKRTGYFYTGMIDEIRAYNRVLSPAEVRYHYNKGGPVAYWKFDEGNGTTTYDSSGNSNTGQTLTAASSPTWVQGKYGSALSFDGVDDYVNVPAASSTDITDAITLSAWIKTSISATRASIVGRYSGGGYYLLEVNQNDGLLRFEFASAVAFNNVSNTSVANNSWTQAVVTYDGSNVKWYINGNLDRTMSKTGSITNGTGNVEIGRLTGGTQLFNGLIDDVRIYNYARTPEQILQDYNGGMAAYIGPSSVNCDIDPGSCMTKGLAGYWNFDEGSGTTTYDGSNSSSTNDGVFVTSASSPAWISGKSGSALKFDGTNDYLYSTGPTGMFYNINNVYTAEAWVKINSLADPMDIFSLGNAGNDADHLSAKAGYIRFSNQGSTWTAQNTLLTLGTWYHVVFIHDGNNDNVKIYINGVKDTDESYAADLALTSSGTGVTVGKDVYGGASWLDGSVDNARFYNRALSEAEIRYHYNRGGPVAYWKFDEGASSTAYDASGNGYNGALQNNMATTSWTSGKYGSALSFDGVNDYVNVTYAGLRYGPSNNFTMSAWFKKDRDKANNTVFFQQSDFVNNFQYGLTSNSNGTFTASVEKDSVGANSANSGVLSLGVWYHAAGVFDGSTIKLYINGALAGSASYIFGSITSADGSAYIGNDSEGVTTRGFSGLIDDVRIYNYARTQEQILQDFNMGKSIYFR